MIRQFTKQKDCLVCLGCCSFFDPDSCWSPLLLEEEASGLKQDALLEKGTLPPFKVPLVATTQGANNFLCSFFEPSSNKCIIYSRRPFECQLYPFLVNRTENGVFLAADLNCPVVKEAHKTEEFKDYAAYLIELLNSPRYLEILNRNPHIVRRYGKVINMGPLKISL